MVSWMSVYWDKSRESTEKPRDGVRCSYNLLSMSLKMVVWLQLRRIYADLNMTDENYTLNILQHLFANTLSKVCLPTTHIAGGLNVHTIDRYFRSPKAFLLLVMW